MWESLAQPLKQSPKYRIIVIFINAYPPDFLNQNDFFYFRTVKNKICEKQWNKCLNVADNILTSIVLVL